MFFVGRVVAAISGLAAFVLDLANKLPGIKFVIVAGIAYAVVAAIPWPEWFDTIGGLFEGLPPGVLYFLNLGRVPEGLAILTSAWGLRFALRWLRAAVSAS